MDELCRQGRKPSKPYRTPESRHPMRPGVSFPHRTLTQAEVDDDRPQFGPPFGELVYPRARRRRQLAAADDSVLLELSESLSQHVRADARKACPQIGEALWPEHHLSNDEQRPPFTDQVEGSRCTTCVVIASLRRHEYDLTPSKS